MLTALLGVATVLLGLVDALRCSGRVGGVAGVVVLAVLPWLVPVAVALPVVALALGRPVLAGVAGALALVLVLTVGRRGLRGRPPDDGPALRLATANLYLGRADAAAVVALVRAERVDVLSAQELTPGLVARLDAAGLAALLPHRVLEPAPGAAGSGIYSRHPLTVLDPVTGGRCAMPRARVHLGPSRVLDVTAVHLTAPVDRGLVDPWQREAGRLEALGGVDVPSVLAGDFNATLDHPPLRRLLRSGRTDAAAAVGVGLRTTWFQRLPAPPLVLDHVLLAGRVAARRATVARVPGSDHRALVVELVLAPES